MLEAHTGPEAAGSAVSAIRQLGRRPDHRQRRAGPAESVRRAEFRTGWRGSPRWGCRWTPGYYLPQLADVIDWRVLPRHEIIMGHVGGVLGYGPYAGKRDEVFASWKRR